MLIMVDEVGEGVSGADLAGERGWWENAALLVNGGPRLVWPLLDAGSDPQARLVAAVYRASAHLHRDAGVGVRRHLLALDAARYGDRELAARINAVPVDGDADVPFRVEWATGGELDPPGPRRLPRMSG
jgi:hypothetical protein